MLAQVCRKPTPVDVYPTSLRLQSFEFIYAKYSQLNDNTQILPALMVYLKKCESSDGGFRKILRDSSLYAAEKIQITNRFNESRTLYCQLLETCTSLMTEQEIKNHILPMIDVNKLKHTDYTQALHRTMYQIFSKVNDEKVHSKFFLDVVFAFANSSFSECDDLLQPMINKVHPVILIQACRQLMKSEVSNFLLDRVAYVLALIYKKNKELFHAIPGFCTGEQYGELSIEDKFSKIRKALSKKN